MRKLKLFVLSALFASSYITSISAQDLKKALIVTVKAKKDQGDKALEYLAAQKPLDVVAKEKGTMTWYFLRDEKNKDIFYVFDTFKDDQGRKEHLTGKIPEAVNARKDLFYTLTDNNIKKVDVILVAAPKK